MTDFAYEYVKKLMRIIGHLKALRKNFHLAPIWYSYLCLFRNGISLSKNIAHFLFLISVLSINR